MPEKIMTSVESVSQADAAWQRGERTFRVISDIAAIVKGKEILCPASEEAGKRTTCESCKLCAGASVKGKSVSLSWRMALANVQQRNWSHENVINRNYCNLLSS
jgi:hypothetical protein